MTVDAAELAALLPGWLNTQRWFAGKSRSSTVSARLLATLTDKPNPVQIWIADVDYGDLTEHYQIPLVFYPEPVENLEYALVGAVADPDGDDGAQLLVYDALRDRDATGIWLQLLAEQGEADGVQFTATSDVADIPVGALSLALTAEQSNTSLVYGDTAIMKVFRRIESGINPDIEVHAELGRLGGRHIATLFGHVGAEVDGAPLSLAMVSEFMKTATDGWELAKHSVRDLMAEADLHADEAGGDFAGEANRLGIATAEVHADLAAAFGSNPLGRNDLSERAAAMNARLDTALAEVPELHEVADGLRAAYAALAEYDEPVLAQRIHGDLHLGQVLRTVHRWVVLDFEGEPAKSIVERREFDAPIRDVAGMLRSFDYAARHQLIDIGSTPQSEFRASEWADRNRTAFCAGYAEAGGLDPEAASVLLRAFEADKAVYEAVYEARNRPGWLPIPLASLHRIADGTEGAHTR